MLTTSIYTLNAIWVLVIKMNKIDEFVNTFQTKNTRKNYRTNLMHYFRTIKADPNTYFNKKRDYEQDVTLFWQELQKYLREYMGIWLALLKSRVSILRN